MSALRRCAAPWLGLILSCSGSSTDAALDAADDIATDGNAEGSLDSSNEGPTADANVDTPRDAIDASSPPAGDADARAQQDTDGRPSDAGSGTEGTTGTDAISDAPASDDASDDATPPMDAGSEGATPADTGADGDGGSCPCVCTPTDCPSACASFATDPKNCGFAGHDCRGKVCTAGQCKMDVFSLATSPYSVVIADSYIYWTELHGAPPQQGDGKVVGRSLIDGSNVVEVGGLGTAGADLIIANATHLFLTSTYMGWISTNSRHDGPFNWRQYVDVGVHAGDVALDATDLYWTDHFSSTIAKAPLSAVDAGVRVSPIVLATNQQRPWGIAVDGANLYWTNRGDGDGSIMKLPLSGGTPTELASLQVDPMNLVVDATHVYWTDNIHGTVMRVGIDGGATEVVASGQDHPRFIVKDASGIYWTNEGAIDTRGSVMKATGVGCTPITLASGLGHPAGIALSADGVYWADFPPDLDAGPFVNGVIATVPK